MKSALPAVLITILICGQAKGEPAWIAGVGSMACREVIEALDGGAAQLAFGSWAAGYVTGINTRDAVQRGYAFSVEGVTAVELLALAVEYCVTAPGAPFVQAVDSTLRQLPPKEW